MTSGPLQKFSEGPGVLKVQGYNIPGPTFFRSMFMAILQIHVLQCKLVSVFQKVIITVQKFFAKKTINIEPLVKELSQRAR